MKKLTEFGPLFIIIAALLWSLDGLLRQSLYSLSPIIVVFLEHALGTILFAPFVFSKLKEIKTITRKEWLAIVIVGLFSGALGTIFYTAALAKINYIQFSVVVLLQQLQPVWAIVTAAILLKERITKKFTLWAGIAIVASYLVTFKDLKVNISFGDNTFVAALLALFAGVMWATSTSFSKIVLKKVSYLTATYLRFIITSIITFVFLIVFNQVSGLDHIKSQQWYTLFLIVFSTGFVALLIYYYGLKKTSARVSAICELVWPVSAIFIDYFYFKKTLSVTQIIGVIIVLFSIYKITSFKNSRV